MTDSPGGALIVFARAPRPGRVKSRLAATLGATQASAIYARLLEHALTLAPRDCFATRHLFCAEADEHDYFSRRLAPGGWRITVQCGADLGERMFNAFAAVLHEARFAVLMGSDIADNTTTDLEQACAALAMETRHAVLGPAADGGYWLLGLPRVRRAYFTGIGWGGEQVAATTRARLQQDGLRVHHLQQRHDIDVADDLSFLAGWDGAEGPGSDAR